MKKKLLLDGLFVLGLAAFLYGVWLTWHPGAYMAGGLGTAAIAFYVGISGKRG